MRAVLIVLVLVLVSPVLHAQPPNPSNAAILAKIAALEQEIARLKTQLQPELPAASAGTAPPSLAAASAQAAKVQHDWPLSPNLGTPPAPPLTGAELAELDRSKFDKVYAAGKAMVESPKYEPGLAAALVTRQAMLAFKTEVAIAADRASSKAEKVLAGKYGEAQWRYELGLVPELHLSLEKWKVAYAKASAALEDANAMYLGKGPK